MAETYVDDTELRAAVHYCWQGRVDAEAKQRAEGLVEDVGLRSGVTSGKHLDPLAALVAKVFMDGGMPSSAIHFKKRVELPGFYRAEKKWDLVVVHEGELVGAVELKSILGSYGNNLNNRSEEAIGNGQDLVEAYQEGRFPHNGRAPWLGYIFIMQEEGKSTKPVGVREPHFSVDSVFQGASYLERAELLCRRLVQKRLYSGACLLVSDGSGPLAVREPAPDLSFNKLAAGIVGRVGEALA